MKKKTLGLLVAAMCLTLSACGAAETSGEQGGSTNYKKILIEYTDDDGRTITCIKKDKFGELLTRVELTTENWRDYIDYRLYEHEEVYTDAFGEVTSTESKQYDCLAGRADIGYYRFEDAVIELKNKETAELITYYFGREYFPGALVSSNNYDIMEDFNLEDYECTRIKGVVYLVDIPEEVIYPLTNPGRESASDGFTLYLNPKSSRHTISLNTATKEIYDFFDWQETYMNN